MIRKLPLNRKKGSEQGIALFMVISTLALLSVLMAELTYSSQMNSRMAYNYVDGLKAYYLAKSAYKISLIRLKMFTQIKGFVGKTKGMKDMVGKNILDKIWNVPFIYPLPIPKEASMSETDAFKDFMKESSLSGSFTANISSESSKLNLNNLFIKKVASDGKQSTSNNDDLFDEDEEDSNTQDKSKSSKSNPNPKASAEPVNFREVLDPAVTALVENKKNDDNEFASVYRNVTGKDIVDAIYAYLFTENGGSALPGFEQIKAKQAPLYSLTELHLIPGIDDELYSLLSHNFTVYSTPGINVNTISKTTLRALIPELTPDDADQLMRVRDDPDVGQPWADEKAFWDSVSSTSVGKMIDQIKSNFKKANIKIITEEESFKIDVLANVGQATRRLEAYVTLDNSTATKKKSKTKDTADNQEVPSSAADVTGGTQVTSAMKPTGLNLIYWRMM